MTSIHRLTMAFGIWAIALMTLDALANVADRETPEEAAIRERAWTRKSLLAGYKSANWFQVLKDEPTDQHGRLLSFADEVFPIDNLMTRYVFNVEETPGSDERFRYTLVLTVQPQAYCSRIMNVEVIRPEY